MVLPDRHLLLRAAVAICCSETAARLIGDLAQETVGSAAVTFVVFVIARLALAVGLYLLILATERAARIPTGVLVGLLLLGAASIGALIAGPLFGAGPDFLLRLRIAAAIPFPIAVLVLWLLRAPPGRTRLT